MALLVLVVVVGAAALFLIPGSTPGMDSRRYPNGLAVLEQVPVNDIQQWVLIRSENVTNPVVLFVHGGPGTSWLTLMRKNTRRLEQYFTVVNWDQRGAGKSFAAGRADAHMTIGAFVDDLVALSSYLAKRFHKNKILLVGHSWGSVLGVIAASRRPDLFSAYVGIGQMSRMAESELLSYTWTLEQAERAKDQSSVKKLTDIGPPPYGGHNWRSKFLTERRILGKHGGEYYGSRSGAVGVVLRNLVFSREYTLLDRINFFRGVLQSVRALYPELSRIDLFAQVPEVKIPVYFCLGRHDYEVPSVLSAKYFEALKAPRKQLIWFDRSAHLPNTEEKDKFNEFMITTVLPGLPE
jgi:pimeloyl-ACP methyl ester carboxylesterase